MGSWLTSKGTGQDETAVCCTRVLSDSMPIAFARLGSRESAARDVFGGKAAGLASLSEAGAEIPGGFCVSAVTSPPQTWQAPERARFEKLAEDLLRSGPIVVRSSAIGEDSASHSFAGLFETVLGVDSVDSALEAASRCIRSGGASRVLEYAHQSEPLPVGLVVQSMVEPRSAGVCFTTDPAGRDGAIVIEAVAGRGDRLVSGTVEPELWRVYRSGHGHWELRYAPRRSVLSTNEVPVLAAAASRFAGKLGHPLDLEWAIDSTGKVWWLQSRPITAAATPPSWEIERSAPDVDDGPVTLWSNWNVRETMPQPLYPLTWTLWRDVVLPMVTDLLYGIPPGSPLSPALNGLDLVEGRIYFNMNALLAAPVVGRLAPLLLHVMDARAAAMLRQLVDDDVIWPRRLPGSRSFLILRMLGAGAVSLSRLSRVLNPRRSMTRLQEGAAAIAGRPPVDTLTEEELLSEVNLWSSPACRDLRDGMQAQALAMIIYGLARWAYARHPEAAGRLAMGTPANPTTRISIVIDGLVDAAAPVRVFFSEKRSWVDLRRELEVAPAGIEWLSRLDSFLAEFGHRGPMEFDVGASRWAEDPSMILDLVRAGLLSRERETVVQRIERLSLERDRILSMAIASSAWWKRPLMRRLKRLVELHMPLREAPKHYGVVVFVRIRKAVRELGRRLVERGVLLRQDDVFFVEWPELVALARGKPAASDLLHSIEARRERLARFQKSRPPDALRSDGVPIDEEELQEGVAGLLRGTAVAAGLARGPVRILREPDPRLMSDGDVLVVEYADPGWTPLFPRAAGIVMEIGGLMCHAALVAREMGVPSVFGVGRAMVLLRDGQLVEVDGSAGTVRVIDSVPAT
jgi:pyruvate,water dikinase